MGGNGSAFGLANELVGALSPVNHGGLHQGCFGTTLVHCPSFTCVEQLREYCCPVCLQLLLFVVHIDLYEEEEEEKKREKKTGEEEEEKGYLSVSWCFKPI